MQRFRKSTYRKSPSVSELSLLTRDAPLILWGWSVGQDSRDKMQESFEKADVLSITTQHTELSFRDSDCIFCPIASAGRLHNIDMQCISNIQVVHDVVSKVLEHWNKTI